MRRSQTQARAFLFTWNPESWGYRELRRLIDQFDAGRRVSVFWRCRAYRQIRPGDRVYLLRQGRPPRGIFATATFLGRIRKFRRKPGENPWGAEIQFNKLVDPTHRLLVHEQALRALRVPDRRWHTQASGVHLEDSAARAIDKLIAREHVPMIHFGVSDDEQFDPKNVRDARQRILRTIVARRGQHAFRDGLIRAFGARCAITGYRVLDILEAAHIYPYRGLKTNATSNGLLLRGDIHTLFDCGLIAINAATMRIVIAPELRKSEYQKLQGKKLRGGNPSKKALNLHRRDAKL